MGEAVKHLNLQLFAGDRSEPATPHRRQEARKKGQVVRSVEVNSALILLATFLFLKFFTPWLGTQMGNFTSQLLGEWTRGGAGSQNIDKLIWFTSIFFLQGCLPIMGVAAGAGLLASYLQVGVLFVGEPLLPRLDRINPAEGFKRIFSRRALMELIKAVLKVVIVGYLAYSTIAANFDLFPNLLDMNVLEGVRQLGELSSTIMLRIAAVLLVLAALDYAFQYWEYERSIMMSKQELKDEFRQYEGDPQIKARIKQLQRQISLHRMMQELPKADVVITNPTHYAVALRYAPEQMQAPTVIAKGVDELALRIKKVAEDNGITLYEDPPLAQTLFKTVEIGQTIPPELYEAVAQVLAFVYKIRPGHFRKSGVK